MTGQSSITIPRLQFWSLGPPAYIGRYGQADCSSIQPTVVRSNLCEACRARHKGIYGALSHVQLDELSAASHKRQIGAGRPLLDPSKSVFQFSVILAGAVKLAKLLPDGRQQIVGMQYAPDFLGRPFCLSPTCRWRQ